MPRARRKVVRWKTSELAAGQQSSDIRRVENCMHHIRIMRPWFLDGEIVAAATGDGIHAGQ